MANPGVGPKFLSVNLNKSYGQSGHSTSSNGGYGSGRGRTGGGGMVVLSRPRSSHKTGPKVFVPPPVNLPSLRREHERFDPHGSGSGSGVGAGSGNGSRPASSAIGWSKPSIVTVTDSEGADNAFPPVTEDWDHGRQSADGSTKSSSMYASMAARPGATGSSHSTSALPQRTTVLRGEDFPSLRATISTATAPSDKRKSSLHQNQKHGMIEGFSDAHKDGSHLDSDIDTRSNRQSMQPSAADAISSNAGGCFVSDAARPSEQARKQDDYFPSPLPVVRLSPRSDWADDERDTSHGFSERNRDHKFSKTESYWEGDFDFPRSSILPHKPAQNIINRWTRHEDDLSKTRPADAPSLGPHSRDMRPASREENKGSSLRAPSSKDGLISRGSGDGNISGARSNSVNHDTVKENTFGRRDLGYGQGGRQQWNKSAESFSGRGAERSTMNRNVSVAESNGHRNDSFQNSFSSRPLSLVASKGLGGGSSLNSVKGNHSFTRSEKPYAEDLVSTNFDDFDPFGGTLLEIAKRKKDAGKKVDFHDPVRESFEAELERVQRLQEQERQRIIEEQERALDLVRKEEEERQRIAHEQEENHRRMEEEAREAAWRAEQERLESIRRAEEQRIAREEEKRRMAMEEERRKQAAKQKLQELEERIARKQAEATGSASVVRERVSEVSRERDASRADEFGGWEDSERMVERITSSVPLDSSGFNRSYDVGSRVHHFKDGPFALPDRGKSNSWRRDANDDSASLFPSEQENIHRSPRRDALAGGRGFSRYETNGFMAPGAYHRGGFSEPHLNDPYGRNLEFDSGYNGVAADRFHEMGWNQGRSHGNLHAPFGDQNSELDELYPYGRPKYSSRQPRVLPPPSLSSMQRTSYRSDSEHTGPAAFIDSITQYNHASGSGRSPSLSIYDENQQEMEQNSDILDVHDEIGKTEVQNLHTNVALRCDSQSSLSVSSPPHSPAHLSHDDLDDTGNSPVACAPAESNEVSYSGNEAVLLGTKTGRENVMTASSDNDDEWDTGNNNDFQVQEEYDEDDDVYDEEDEVHEDNENVDLAQEFEGIRLEEEGPSMVENVVLGFDQGVEVGIPSDEIERSLSNEETRSVQQSSVGSAEQSKSFIEQEHTPSTQFGEACCKIENRSPGTFHEAQSATQDLVTQPTNDSHTSALPDQLSSGNLSFGSVLSGSQSVHSSADMSSYSSSPALLSSASSSNNQAEMPVKLQFGLFSGPSLVSPPISAIQIGSIQMPLPLHHKVGPSLSHIHPPQPTVFQFGQLRYPSPVSQGPFPLTHQSMTFSQPNVPANYPLNNKPGVLLPGQSTQVVSSHNLARDGTFLLRRDSQQQEASVLKKNEGPEKSADLLHMSSGQESSNMNQPGPESSGQEKRTEGSQYRAVVDSSPSIGQALKGQLLCETNLSRTVRHGQSPGGRGRKVHVTSGGRSLRQKMPFSTGDTSRFDGNGYQRRPRRDVQRMEFRVKKSADRRHSFGTDAVDQSITYVKSSNNRRGPKHFSRSRQQNEPLSNRTQQTADFGNFCADKSGAQGTSCETKTDKGNGRAVSSRVVDASHLAEGRLKRNIRSEEDVDAPLQSGVVRIFNQPGIEAPSDEDDFIEVRSKRQVLNDRREQREKEKAKSSNKRDMRKPRSTSQGMPSAINAIRASNGEALNTIRADAIQKRGLMNEMAKGSGMVSQPLAPIGTPPVNVAAPATANSHSQINMTPQTSSPSVSSRGQTLGHDVDLKSKKKLPDGTKASLGSWDSAPSSQEVMPLTQTQFDDAMKPGQFDMHSSSNGDHIKTTSELCSSTSPVNLNDTLFPSVTCPINSLLAGEKIQFGAITSPTVLPPSGPARPHVVRSDGSQSDLHNSRERSPINSDRGAEPDAAASAIVAAAISNDEAVGNGLGTGPDSVSDTKGDLNGNQSAGESKGEEVLNVSLPADLSVETPPMSLWPPLPSSHVSSSHMVPSFPGGAASHFPFYDVNPMLGGRIFTFGPHDESAGPHPQPQNSGAPGLSPPGTWQPCQSSVDSFYAPTAGFTGPFINPPGTIPAGVSGSPHMVVYNHFAPVGRFGQVGLSYMGTYISSTKQPDWKHNPSSASAGDVKIADMVSAQHNLPGVPQAQHVAPGSPLLPMPLPPVAMLDVSPFQPSAEPPPQAWWPHLPGAPSLHPIPQSVPASQHSEKAVPSQLSQATSDSRSHTVKRLSKPQTQTLSEDTVSAVTDLTAPLKAEKPEQAGPRSSNGPEPPPAVGSSVSSPDANKDTIPAASSDPKLQAPDHRSSSGRQRYSHHSSGYNHHRGGGGGSQRNGSGAEWSNRRTGFHGRNPPGGGGRRGFSQTKMKQIYVAKQSSGGPSTSA